MSQLLETDRPIFRASALERNLHAREEAELPRFLRPRTRALLWALLALLVAAGALAWSVRVPIHATCAGVALDRDALASHRVALASLGLDVESSVDPADPLVVLAFLPVSAAGAVQPGDVALAAWSGARGDSPPERAGIELLAVDDGPSSPDALRARWRLEGAAAAVLDAPCVAALARAPAPPAGLQAGDLAGALLTLDVRVGERRVLALLPWIGRWFDGAR
jgi:hypothetical protein